MSNPNTFMRQYEQKTTALINLIEELRGLNDWIVQDDTLLDRYFAQPNPPVQVGQELPRADIDKADVEAAKTAIDQVIFAYDSGNPTQKSAIFKIIP